MSSDLAPVVITVYTRLSHLKKCVEALIKNDLASNTIVYFFSDAPLVDSDKESVNLVREYILSITGFKRVVPVFRVDNVGAVNNYKMAFKEVFEKHESLIFMEDDVVTGKGFLKFINEGLVRYKKEKSVVGICGYIPPVLDGVEENVFFLKRRMPYGFGCWKNKELLMQSIAIDGYYDRIIKDWEEYRLLLHFTPILAKIFPLIAKRDFIAGDMETGIVMRLNDFYALYPPKTLVRNIGLDGSGLNCRVNSELQNQKVFEGVVKVVGDPAIKEKALLAEKIRKMWLYKGSTFVNWVIFIGYKYFNPLFYPFYIRVRRAYKKIMKN